LKKLFWGATVLLMIASVLFSALPALADDGDNFRKAGKQALQEREEVLIVKKAGIDSYIQQAGGDRLVTKKEMLVLWDKVDDFFSAKRKFDNYLVFYKLKTLTDLDKGIVEAVDTFSMAHLLMKSDRGDMIKTLFISRSGQDVIVEGGMVVKTGEFIAIVIGVLSFFSMIWGAFLLDKRKEARWMIVLGLIFFVLVFFLLFL